MAVQKVYVVNHRPAHVAHLIMTLLTFGCWLPIWILACVSAKIKTRWAMRN